MNALDQALIKAFTKNRSAACSEQESATIGSKIQPPETGVESMALVLHDLYPQGLRFRIDRPTSTEASYQAAHMIMPIVEQVQSYQPDDIATSTLSQVVIEDRLQALEKALQEIEESAASDTSATSNAGRPDRDAPDEEQADPAAAAVKPLVLVAVPDLCRPELQTKELGCLIGRHDPLVRGSTTAVEIGGFDFDPALLDGSPTADRSEHVANRGKPATAATCVCFDDDLTESRSTASDGDDVALPIRDEVAPAHHGLSEAEEAALLGGVEQSVLDPFAPAWEVDAFRWPDLCTQLDEASGRKLAHSGDELYVATQDGLKVIAITSTERQAGRTTIALSLARSAAAAGCRVALLDADCANPELARRLGLDSPCDWQQVRRHRQPLCEAAVVSLDDRVTLFPLTVPDDDLSGRLDDPTLTGVLQELKRSFDLVVVDTPPVAAGDTRVAVATCPCEVDMVVVVRNMQTTPQDKCLSTVARLRAMGVRAVGIVENFTPADEAAV